ncbi:hypothetical protein NDU88_005100 [Pleurodeles waltl]|uniref:Secreted protein n=1 Tax=Pleurodeles waltl TaxID=8319 RepID=A0AAV7NLG6_PLEWA|nr:hypothetical protein NDU88_005100 [Pleurodeles waltl]
MAYMLWSCPMVAALCQEVTDTHHWTQGALPHEVRNPGLYKRKKTRSATVFLDLTLLMVRTSIVMHWKASTLPGVQYWCAATLKWGTAEPVDLRREEARGLSRVPIATE